LKYSIFHHIIQSNILLPELQESRDAEPSLFFQSSGITEKPNFPIDWCHHWRRPDGSITISVGKNGDYYWVRFPRLVDFQIHSFSNRIIAYRHKHIPDNTIRHLLLDQIIPRLLSHNGQLIVHASCVQIGHYAVAFCGESGWGKSTLAAYFHSRGYPLITDDCLLLQTKNSVMTGIPNYCGLRLLPDSLTALPESFKESSDVCHYASKKRIFFSEEKTLEDIQIANLFFLGHPSYQDDVLPVRTSVITGAAVLIELIKHCFPLDITNMERTGNQLENLAHLIKNCNTHFYRLNYPHIMQTLPDVLDGIVQATSTHSDKTLP